MSKIKSCGQCGVEIQNLNVTMESLQVLKNINLTVRCGEFTALIGRNGAGKTTLLKAILEDIKYDGKIQFIDHCGCGVEHAHVGYVPQGFYFDKNSPISVSDFLLSLNNKKPVFFGHGKSGDERVSQMLKTVDGEYLAKRRLGDLSGGEMQRVMLAFALNPIPDLLVLDEPISGIDQRGMDMFYKLVAELREEHHIAVLLVSHDFLLVEKYATNVILIDGEIKAEGSYKEVASSKYFIDTFGIVDEPAV